MSQEMPATCRLYTFLANFRLMEREIGIVSDVVDEIIRQTAEHCARIAVYRSCSWTTEDDKRSNDFREGLETGASQIAATIREQFPNVQSNRSV